MSTHASCICLAAFLLLRLVSAIWPQPVFLKLGADVRWFDPNARMSCEDEDLAPGSATFQTRFTSQNVYHENRCLDSRVTVAWERAYDDVVSRAFVPWKFNPRGVDYEPDVSTNSNWISLIKVVLTHLAFSNDHEAYEIRLPRRGSTTIRVNHPLGAIHAFHTLTQLFFRHSDTRHGNASCYIPHVPLLIQDYPTFSHRGLNLDISRNVIGTEAILRTLHAMAFNKFNRLHLHASDAQSWPLEVPTLPDLASRGAYHASQIWSAADLRTVQSYAASLGIEVYIEIDMPGHMASVGCAYPDIIASWNKQPWGNYSAQPPSGQLRLDNERAYGFIDALLGDLLPRVSQFSSYFHLGGDELYPAAYGWTIDETRHHLQRFLNHTISKVKEHGLAPIVWEELLLDYNLTLPSDLIVQTWRSNSSKPASQVPIAEVTDRGYQALFGANDYWYLDCGHGTWLDPDPQNPKSPIKKPFLDYCGPFHNWRHVYTYEPLVNIPDSKRHLVVGGEASMWTEQTDEVNLDANVWPRLAAAGEVLWHRPVASITEDVTRRLSLMREWLVRKGVAAPPVQVTWCLMNQGSCLA